MIQIDGSFGEGGGQVLRTSLTLSLITGQSFEIYNIRAKRKRPGLQPQHLKCVEAARLISNGIAKGDKIGSTHLIFEPGAVTPGEYRLDIGTAGSTTLVLHTVYLPLALSDRPSNLCITGGTHVQWSPCFHYLTHQWQPYLEKIGFQVKLRLDRAGFYPKGDGKMQAEIWPAKKLSPIQLERRGELRRLWGISAIANLDVTVAERQRNQSLKRLERMGYQAEIGIEQMPSRYKSTMMLLAAEFEQGSGCFTALGEIGKRAEQVADEAVAELEEYLSSDGCVDKYLADQLILPLAFADGESVFTVSKITNHLLTNIAVVQKFLDLQAEVKGDLGASGTVQIAGRGALIHDSNKSF